MPDIFSTSYASASNITPSDATTYQWIRGLIVTAVGAVTITPGPGAAQVVFAATVVGQYIPIVCYQVNAATAATVVGVG